MGKTLAEKILSAKSNTEAYAGNIVVARLDLVFVQDSTGPLTLRQFAETGLNIVHNPQKTIIFIDHSVPSPAKELSNDHIFLRPVITQNEVVCTLVPKISKSTALIEEQVAQTPQ